MEELHKLTPNMKIMEEVKANKAPKEPVTVNGEPVKLGSGNQHILHLFLNNESIARISFFARKDEELGKIDELRTRFLKSLCRHFVEPLSKLQKQLESNVAFQA